MNDIAVHYRIGHDVIWLSEEDPKIVSFRRYEEFGLAEVFTDRGSRLANLRDLKPVGTYDLEANALRVEYLRDGEFPYTTWSEIPESTRNFWRLEYLRHG